MDSIAVADRIPEGRAAVHVVLALDVWSGRDFTQRNRAVGLGWLPFVDPPEHEETDETREARLDRVYDLNKTERAEVEGMRVDLVNRFAYVAGLIAARIHAYPAWRLDFFDEHNVRIDLAAQVSAIAASAALLRDQRALLGDPPAGHLSKDADVVGVYVEKARVLDSRADGLLRRVQAFAEYREVVDGVQKREDKRAWFDRVGAIDELEREVPYVDPDAGGVNAHMLVLLDNPSTTAEAGTGSGLLSLDTTTGPHAVAVRHTRDTESTGLT